MTSGDNTVVVDTDVFSNVAIADRRRPEYEPHLALLQGRRIVLSVQTVAEIKFGAWKGNWGSVRLAALDARLDGCRIMPITRPVAEVAARLRHECQQRGHPLHDRGHGSDLWIAATARHLALPVVSNDQIFDDAPGVTVLRP